MTKIKIVVEKYDTCPFCGHETDLKFKITEIGVIFYCGWCSGGEEKGMTYDEILKGIKKKDDLSELIKGENK